MKENRLQADKKQSHQEGPGTFPSAERTGKMVDVLKKDAGRRFARFMKDGCVHCGLCAEACHYYLSEADADHIPANKSKTVCRIMRKYGGTLRNRFPAGGGGRAMETEEERHLFRATFENCSLCGRCSLACPMGLNTRRTLYLARKMFAAVGTLPSGLDGPVRTAMETGNYIGLSTEDFVENIEWVGEELADEMETEDFPIPLDKQGAEILYIPHPLEVRDYPFLFMASVKVLNASGADYTFSSHCFDTTNYGFYQGNTENTLKIVSRMTEAREKIGARSIVLSPCGHGYRVLRYEAEELLGKRFDFDVFTLVEFLDRCIGSGRILLEEQTLEGPVTFHDPCNIGRLGGIVEEPRRILRRLTPDFVEMHPHGVWSYCCGGGGGLSATGDYGQKRIQVGRAKAEQIRQTRARIVATGCYNCRTQISELNRAYELGVEVKSIVELVADALRNR
jgi:Fe-S oxidoreductase